MLNKIKLRAYTYGAPSIELLGVLLSPSLVGAEYTNKFPTLLFYYGKNQTSRPLLQGEQKVL